MVLAPHWGWMTNYNQDGQGHICASFYSTGRSEILRAPLELMWDVSKWWKRWWRKKKKKERGKSKVLVAGCVDLLPTLLFRSGWQPPSACKSSPPGDLTIYYQPCVLGCFRKILVQVNQKYNPPSISLGDSLEGSKRIYNFDKVWGCL